MTLIHEVQGFCRALKRIYINVPSAFGRKLVFAIIVACVVCVSHFGFLSRVRESKPQTSSSRPRLYVTYFGRLGNQMFQVASLKGLAKTNNMTALVPVNSQVWKVFKVSGKPAKESDLPNAVRLEDTNAGMFYEKYHHLREDTVIYSYLQSFKYFENVREDLLKRDFAFKDHIQQTAEKYIADVLREKGNPRAKVVGVHVRRGDFVRQIKKGYGVATRPYLYRAMNYFRRKYDNVVFIVASNDIYWCRDNMIGPYDIHFSHNQDGALDLAVLVNSDDVIITTGSFSWWAGYLNKGETVYFKGYPIEGTWLAEKYVKTDYYPPAWTPM